MADMVVMDVDKAECFVDLSGDANLQAGIAWIAFVFQPFS